MGELEKIKYIQICLLGFGDDIMAFTGQRKSSKFSVPAI